MQHKELQPVAQLFVALYVLLKVGSDRPPEVELALPLALASVLIANMKPGCQGKKKHLHKSVVRNVVSGKE